VSILFLAPHLWPFFPGFKLQFLNCLAGRDAFLVGHNLKSETAKIQELQVSYEDEKGHLITLCLVDTPGFGDTYKP